MCDILLVGINARYRHSAFGLRYLLANLAEMRPRTRLLEADGDLSTEEMAERILSYSPRIVGLGVYIWNAAAMALLVPMLKGLHPALRVILGGPQVSFRAENPPWVDWADHVVAGEGEVSFPALCRQILAGNPPTERFIQGIPPDLATLTLPYDLYSDQDIAHREIYVESSRGCAFRCSFCLSSLDATVRRFPLDKVLPALDALMARGARRFKFVDRTFNLALKEATAILEFFLARLQPRLFVHFEVIPDRFPPPLRALIARFPPGTLQLEVGIQTFNPRVQEAIARHQDMAASLANLRWLAQHAHLHSDLIVALPGEDLTSFAQGFDRLIAEHPHEIQVGILKRLPGTPLTRVADDYGYLFSAEPPHEVLKNDLLDFFTLRRLKRFARFWDLVGNSGRFTVSLPLILHPGSPFARFMALSEWIFAQVGRTHSIALRRLFALVCEGMTAALDVERTVAEKAVGDDVTRAMPGERLDFMPAPATPPKGQGIPRRQRRHLTGGSPLA